MLTAQGGCVCGAVRFEIDVPAVWAWHDHSPASRRAHGAAYATYVGQWKSRFRLIEGGEHVSRFEEAATGAARSFCARCGTPLIYERAHAPKMVNIPRALFETGVRPRAALPPLVEETRRVGLRGRPSSAAEGLSRCDLGAARAAKESRGRRAVLKDHLSAAWSDCA